MTTRRLLIDSVAMAVVAALLGVVGWLASEPLLRVAAELLGVDRWTMTSRYELVWYRVSLALAFALPPIATWIAALIRRAIAREVPPWTVLAQLCLVPAGGVFLAIATRLRDFAVVGRDAGALGGMEPIVTVGSIDLGTRAIAVGATFSVVMWTLLGWASARRARREPRV